LKYDLVQHCPAPAIWFVIFMVLHLTGRAFLVAPLLTTLKYRQSTVILILLPAKQFVFVVITYK